MRWTVGKKIMFGFTIVLLFMMIIGLMATLPLARINNRLNEVVDVVSTRQLLSAQITQDILRIARAEKNLILETEPEEMDKYAAAIDEYEKEMTKRLEKLYAIATPEGKNAINKFKKAYNGWKKNDLAVQKLSREATNIKARALSAEQGRILFDRVEAYMTDFVDRNGEEMVKEKEISDRNYVLARNLLWGTLILAILVSIGMSFFISGGITKSLSVVVDKINAGAEGDLIAKVHAVSKDEIGDVAKAFNKMLDDLKAMVIKVLESSQSVSASSQQLSSAVQQANASVQQVSSAIQQLAKGAQTQTQRVEETTRVMEQLNASISQTAQSAQEAASASSKANRSAEKGAETIKETVSTMDKIFKSTTVTSEAVKKLSERSEQMAEIVEAITNIADQTNLLALNAAIEAARAGEQGRGFAVVAEEVKELSESSAKSATAIGKLIKETSREIDDAVKNMEMSKKEVTSGKELMAGVGAALEEILQASQNVATMLQQISAASQQMSSGAKQVVRSVEDVAAVAEETSASTQQVNASTQQMVDTMKEISSSAQLLAQMGIELNNLVEEFKTNEEEKVIMPEPRAPRSRKVAPIDERLAQARKKMKKIKRPRPLGTEEAAKP